MKEIDNETATAEYTGLNIYSMRNGRCGCGDIDIPYLKLGRSVRYRKSDVDAWLEARLVSIAPKTTEAV